MVQYVRSILIGDCSTASRFSWESVRGTQEGWWGAQAGGWCAEAVSQGHEQQD